MISGWISGWPGHVKNTTCAAMSPNGQWVASGDTSGAIRLWGAKGEHAQKNEYKLWDALAERFVSDLLFFCD